MLRFSFALLVVAVGCGVVLRAQETDSTTTPKIELAGRVLDRDGEPLAGVHVLVDIRRDKGGKTASVGTDRDGAFRYTTDEVGDVTLSVFKPALGRVDLGLGELGAGTRRTELVLQLGDGNFVSGRVQWPDGTPADVVVLADEAGSPHIGARRARTGADGSFRIDGLGPGPFDLRAESRARALDRKARATVKARALRRAPRRELDERESWSAFAFGVAAGSGELVLTLGPGECLQGVVRASDGTPVREFSVRVRPEDARHGVHTEHFETELGAFKLEGLAAGRWRVEVQAEGFQGASATVVLPLAEPFVLELVRRARIFGRVLAPDGTPVASAEVRLMVGELVACDSMGRYETSIGPSGTLLVALAAGYAPSERTAVSYSGGFTQELDLHLRPSESIQGVVHDVGGIPAAEAEVQAGGARARTGPDGRFTITDLPPGDVALSARLASGVHLWRRATVVAGTACEVLLAPPSGEPILLSGRVRIGDGSVRWSGYAKRDRESDTYPIVSKDGRYTLALPGPGAWELHLACGRDSRANEFQWRHSLELGAEREHTLDLELSLVHLRGRVTDANGAPVADFRVSAQQQPEGNTRVTGSCVDTDADGRYDLLLSPGTFNLSAHVGADKLELEGLVIGSEDPEPRDLKLAPAPR